MCECICVCLADFSTSLFHHAIRSAMFDLHARLTVFGEGKQFYFYFQNFFLSASQSNNHSALRLLLHAACCCCCISYSTDWLTTLAWHRMDDKIAILPN